MSSKFFESIYRDSLRKNLREYIDIDKIEDGNDSDVKKPVIDDISRVLRGDIEIPQDAEIYPYFVDTNGKKINSYDGKIWETLKQAISDILNNFEDFEDIQITKKTGEVVSIGSLEKLSNKAKKIDELSNYAIKGLVKNILMGICGIDLGWKSGDEINANSYRYSAYDIATWGIDNPKKLPIEWQTLYNNFSKNGKDYNVLSKKDKNEILNKAKVIIKIEGLSKILSKKDREEVSNTVDDVNRYLKNINNSTTVNDKLLDLIKKSIEILDKALEEYNKKIDGKAFNNLSDEESDEVLSIGETLETTRNELDADIEKVKAENDKRYAKAEEIYAQQRAEEEAFTKAGNDKFVEVKQKVIDFINKNFRREFYITINNRQAINKILFNSKKYYTNRGYGTGISAGKLFDNVNDQLGVAFTSKGTIIDPAKYEDDIMLNKDDPEVFGSYDNNIQISKVVKGMSKYASNVNDVIKFYSNIIGEYIKVHPVEDIINYIVSGKGAKRITATTLPIIRKVNSSSIFESIYKMAVKARLRESSEELTCPICGMPTKPDYASVRIACDGYLPNDTVMKSYIDIHFHKKDIDLDAPICQDCLEEIEDDIIGDPD